VSIIHFPLSDDSDSCDTLPPLFSLIRTSYAITNLSLFNQRITTLLVVSAHRNEVEKITNSPSRLCPNFAKETIRIGFKFKHFDHHKGTTHPSKSSLGRYCSKTTISNSTPSCRQPWLLYHTGDIKECTTL